MQYEILEHTADLKIRAYGKNLPELFSNMLKGMFEACGPTPSFDRVALSSDRAKFKIRKIRIKSQSIESLLIDFLSEALYLSDVNNETYLKAEFEKLIEKELVGKIFGQKVEKLQKEIKAVTWHDLEIKKIPAGWQATVLFDI